MKITVLTTGRTLAAFAVLLLLPFAPHAQAGELLMTPNRAGASSGAELKRILQDAAKDIRIEPIFGFGEVRTLLSMGAKGLAQSLKVTTKTSAQEAMVRRRALRSGWSADRNGVGKLQEIPSLDNYQWGLQNVGKPQLVRMSDSRTVWIEGQVGQDIGLTRARPPRVSVETPVIVGVLDTGIEGSIPDLKGQYIRPEKDPEVPTSSQSLDDKVGHGSHCAGTIAANGKLMGVAPMAKILPLKVYHRTPNAPIRPQADPASPETEEVGAFADEIAHGILYAVKHGARVINLSMAWPKAAETQVLRDMVALAVSKKVLFVSAAGNDSTQVPVFPCSYDGVICVGAHGPDGALSHFSNYGASVDVAAPGLSILSTWPTSPGAKAQSVFTAYPGYEYKSGTSMAAPFVSGMAARLLSEGFSPEETRARILLGTRKIAPTDWENPVLLNRLRKWIVRGNADLQRALEIPAQPLFERTTKDLVELKWNPTSSAPMAKSFLVSVSLTNAWESTSGEVSARLKLVPWEGNSPTLPARLSQSAWRTSGWKSGDIKTIETTLVVDRPEQLESRFFLELELSQPGTGRETQTLYAPIQISRLMNGNTSDRAIRLGSFAGEELILDEGSQLRSVHASDGNPSVEFFSIRELQPAPGAAGNAAEDKNKKTLWELQRLTRSSDERNGSVRISVGKPFQVNLGPTDEGLEIYKIDRLKLSDGSVRYTFVALLKTLSKTGIPIHRITLIRENGEVDQVIESENIVSALPDTFRWMAMEKGELPRPAWIGPGTTPKLEKPPLNAWDLNPKDLPQTRLYYLAKDGLRSLAAPNTTDGKVRDWIGFIRPSTEDLRLGRIRALLASGEDNSLSYTIATIRNAKVESLDPLTFSPYRNLERLHYSGPVTALSPGFDGTYYSGIGTIGSMRSTLLYNPGGTADLRQSPISRFDSTRGILGVFAGPSTLGSFVETHYQLQYHDHLTGEVAFTSLGRYSFLPDFIFTYSYFPEVTQDGVPAIPIPFERGLADGFEVVNPERAQTGELQIARRALNRWETGSTCSRIGNPIRNEGRAGFNVAWICNTGWRELSF